MYFFCLIAVAIVLSIIYIQINNSIREKQFQKELQQLNSDALRVLKLDYWKYKGFDEVIKLKTSKGVDDYTEIKFFKDNRDRVDEVNKRLNSKKEYADLLSNFLEHNEFTDSPAYSVFEHQIRSDLKTLYSYNVDVRYISPTGKIKWKTLLIDRKILQRIMSDPSLIMSKAEYNKLIKEQNKEALNQKHRLFYEMVNGIIDLANKFRNDLIIEKDKDELDRLVSLLFDKTVNTINKIKSLDSDEWSTVEKIITNIKQDVDRIIKRHQLIIDYYNSDDFKKIKETCNHLMTTQKEFNEYINEKAQSISTLFGSRIVRTETVNNDEYNFIRPYKKSITPFTAEVSSAVFASAENNPLDYIIKFFYPNKAIYPEQIQKLQLLIEELETLKEAKKIIENYKKDYQQYITDVPSFIMDNDEDGFYSRLGFANISENVLTVEYKFSYTSEGGMAQRYFTVPMTEETVIELVNKLQSKLTMSAFVKEQRAMMTSKLRQHIKERDNFTCKFCGNSTFAEPNLLLEIDHVIPVAKGGYTIEDNLQTLCWKCNREKSCKIIDN